LFADIEFVLAVLFLPIGDWPVAMMASKIGNLVNDGAGGIYMALISHIRRDPCLVRVPIANEISLILLFSQNLLAFLLISLFSFVFFNFLFIILDLLLGGGGVLRYET